MPKSTFTLITVILLTTCLRRQNGVKASNMNFYVMPCTNKTIIPCSTLDIPALKPPIADMTA